MDTQGKTQEHRVLFGGKDPGRTEPPLLLLDAVLSPMPKEEQINQITEVLVGPWVIKHDEKAIVLIDALEKLFENKGPAFRKYLQEVYNKLPDMVKVGEQWSDLDRKHVPVKALAVPKLKLAILGKILRGWYYEGRVFISEPSHPSEDAEECFRFVCDAYKNGDNEEFRKGILELFRTYLEKTTWRATELTPWILRDKTPHEIAVVLLKARTRIGGETGTCFQELGFLEPFAPHQRSPEAISFIQEHMRKIRKTEETARQLVEQITPYTILLTHFSPRAVSSWKGDAKVCLESETTAWIRIVFKKSLHPPENDYPRIVAEIQGARDKLLKKIEEPPTLLIEAEGPGNFHYKEG